MRVTKKGLDYANEVVLDALNEYLDKTEIDDMSGMTGRTTWTLTK